jgi:hypothetical protein
MVSPIVFSVGFAVLMAGLLIEAALFRAVHDDPPSIYSLFALRDKLVRLVVDGKIERNDPHFEAVYRNVNVLLNACRRISGPNGWKVAEAHGKHLAHHPSDPVRLVSLPPGELPAPLEPVVVELRLALEHIVDRHFGLNLVISERRREQNRIRRAKAKALLQIVTCPA